MDFAGELHRYDRQQICDKFGVEQVWVGQEVLHKVRGRGTVMIECVGEKPACPPGEDSLPQPSPTRRSSLLTNSIEEPHKSAHDHGCTGMTALQCRSEQCQTNAQLQQQLHAECTRLQQLLSKALGDKEELVEQLRSCLSEQPAR